jgi:hypothetical protein
VHGATLNRRLGPERGERLLETRRAVDDDEFRRLQSTFDEIVEECPPGGFAFADSRQHGIIIRCSPRGDFQHHRPKADISGDR